MDLLFAFFVLALFLNARAAFKLALDWKGMVTTLRFARDAYARLDELPGEEALERDPRAPIFLHLVPAYQEPEIAGTVRALIGSRYPHGGLHVVVVTKEEEERTPHPGMGVSTGELVRRLRETLPPYQQKRLSHVAMPGSGRKAHQLNWALRPEVLREILGEETDPRRVFVGVSDADSIPDPDTYRWIAHRELSGPGSLAYQGIPLSLANYDRLDIRGRICAIQQSSIFIRVSIARLINEVKRIRLFGALAARGPRPPPRLRVLLPPLADLPRAQPVRAPRRHAGGGRLPHLGRHRGLYPRLRPGGPRHPDRSHAHARADRPARDDREGDPPERALVPGRARRHALPPRDLAREADGLQLGAAHPPCREQGDRVAGGRAGLSLHRLARLVSRVSVPWRAPGA